MTEPKITRRKITEYLPDPSNANLSSERGHRMIDDSVSQDGAGRSGLADKNGTLIAGNQTLQAMVDNGIEDVIEIETSGKEWVIVRRNDADLNDPDPNNLARRMAFRDNRTQELSLTWNPEQLLADLNAGVDLTQFFQADELDELLADLRKDEQKEDGGAHTDRAGELQAIWQVQRGDVWAIGKHRLMCGDSTSADDVARLMDGECARAIWTDPPYGVGHSGGSKDPRARTYRSGDKLQNDDLTEADTEALITDAFKNAYAHSETGAAIYVACPPGRLHRRFIDAMDNSGFPYHQGLVWVKDTFVFGRSDYHYRHEPILYGWKNDGGHYFIDDRTQDTIFEIPRPTNSQEDEGHPTSKPVELVKQMIANSAKMGEIVYDPFTGSGTTLVACEQTGRRGYGMEIAPEYCSVILQRLKDMGQSPELER